MTGVLRPYTTADAEAVLALNAANVPEVGEMDADKLALLEREALVIIVVDFAGEIAGFVVVLTDESTGYTSPNYAWFADRHRSFAYVDRVAVAAAHRGQEWGQQLYMEAETYAVVNGRTLFCAEVNTVPDNPRSHRFHRRFGFAPVARLRPYDDDREVEMYEKVIDSVP